MNYQLICQQYLCLYMYDNSERQLETQKHRIDEECRKELEDNTRVAVLSSRTRHRAG
jgi:hypothetical protein